MSFNPNLPNNYTPLGGTINSGDTIPVAISKLDGKLSFINSNEIRGNIYTDNFNRASLGTNYTLNLGTSTASIVSNVLVISAGTNSWNEYIEYSPYAFITYKNSLTARYQVQTLNTKGVAFAFGGSSDLSVWLDNTTSSASVLRLYKAGAELFYTNESDPSTMVCNLNDFIKITMIINGQDVIVTAYNENTYETKTISYSYTEPVITSSRPYQRISKLRIHSLGGTHSVYSVTIDDNSPKFIELGLLGDSKMWGGASSERNGYSDALIKTFPNTRKICFPGSTLAELNNATFLSDIVAQKQSGKSYIVFVEGGYNDIAGGATAATAFSNLQNIVTTLQAGGVTVWIFTSEKNAAVQATLDTFNTSIRSTYGATNIIIDVDKIVSANGLKDGVHPSDSSYQWLYDLLYAKLKGLIKETNYKPYNVFSEFPSYKSSNAYTIATANAIISNTQRDIAITNNVNWSPRGYALITAGGGNEIIYYNGLNTGNLLNCNRGLFGTTAFTIPSGPSQYQMYQFLELTYRGTQVISSKTSNGFHGFNTAEMHSNQNEYHFSLLNSGNPTVMWKAKNGGSPIHQYDKGAAGAFTSMIWSTAGSFNYTIAHGNDTRLYFGRYNQSDQTIDVNGNFGFGATSNIYRTTNGGSDITFPFIIDPARSLVTGKAYGFDSNNGFVFTDANGTRRIATAAIKTTNVVLSAGTESSDLSFYTKSSGGSISESFRITSTKDINVFGNLIVSSSTISSSSTLSNQGYIYANGTITVTLPDSTLNLDKLYIIKNIGTGTITINTTSSQTIDGLTTKTLSTQYQWIYIKSNGTNWYVVG